MQYVRRYFALNARQDDGATLAAHLQQAAKLGSAAAKAELAEEMRPGPLAYLWGWFLELHGHRGAGPMGPAAVTWPDLDAWARRTRRDPEAWEFDVLAQLDGCFFASVSSPREAR